MKSKVTGSGRGFGRVLFLNLIFLYKKITRPTSLRVEEETKEGEEAREDDQGSEDNEVSGSENFVPEFSSGSRFSDLPVLTEIAIAGPSRKKLRGRKPL